MRKHDEPPMVEMHEAKNTREREAAEKVRREVRERAQREAEAKAIAEKAPIVELKTGYRQGLITSITVVLTASVLFFRFAVFEPGSGDWTVLGGVAAFLAAVSIGIQLWTLWRALQPEDAEITAYRSTLENFKWAVFFLVLSLIVQTLAMLVYRDNPAPPVFVDAQDPPAPNLTPSNLAAPT